MTPAPQRFIQLVHTLSYGDAISTEVLALDRCFKELGAESEIYALNEHPNLRGRTNHFSDFAEYSGTATLILHYSLGSPLNKAYASWTQGKKILIYHNITPAFWYRSINQRVSQDIERGIVELPGLCSLSDHVLADSSFNVSELRVLGFDAEVLKLPIDPRRWDLPRNEGIYSIVKSEDATHLLHVGRLAPNKCVEDIIKVFYFFRHYGRRKSRLWLVGIDTDTELYSFSLRRLVAELGLEEQVSFVGCFADEEVRSLYESCDAYLCMSEHEGFCLPIVEAMHFGLPVFAFANSAVPDTVGDGGILFSEKRHAEIAELMLEVLSKEDLKEKIIRCGRERVKTFSYAAFKSDVQSTFQLGEVLAS